MWTTVAVFEGSAAQAERIESVITNHGGRALVVEQLNYVESDRTFPVKGFGKLILKPGDDGTGKKAETKNE